MAATGKIFISYRREESRDISGRIYDWLTQRLPRGYVFKDVFAIGPGEDFMQKIEQTIQQSKAMLVVIGPRWLEGATSEGAYALREVELGLKYGLKIIPLLVDNASMPARAALPESIRALADRNAWAVRGDPDFPDDMAKLSRPLGVSSRSSGASGLPVRFMVAAVSALVLIALGLGILTTQPPDHPILPLFANAGNTSGPTATSTDTPNPTFTPMPTFTPQIDETNPYRPGSSLTFHDFRASQTSLTERWDFNANCIYSNGVYRIVDANARVFFPCDAHGTFTNFTYEVKMTFVTGSTSRGGMILRDGHNGHFYTYDFGLDGSYALWWYPTGSGSTARQLASGSAASFRTGLGQTNTIAVVASGSTFQLYVNFDTVKTVFIPSSMLYTSGDVGVYTYSGGSASQVQYTDARLWRL
jgi:TIR domain